MARDNEYNNDFTGNSMNGGVWIQMQNATDVGVLNNELALFTNENKTADSNNLEGGKFTFPSSLVNDDRADHFEATMDIKLIASPYAKHGNKQPDGLSFSFGNTNSFPRNPWVNLANGYDFEKGVGEGLSISIIPYGGGHPQERGTLVISWNGAVIGSTPFTGSGDFNSSAVTGTFQRLTVAVSDTGSVSASYGGVQVTANIPNQEWQTQSQEGWDFALAGRTGANGGFAYVDNLHVESRILLCFTAGTFLDCENGPRLVEDLDAGDLVLTRDEGPQPVRWIGRRRLERAALEFSPRLRPIRIAAGALGRGRPSADLVVSPQHRILIDSPIAQRMFGTSQVLIAARQLCAIPGIAVDETVERVDYFHLMFDRHQIVTANGCATESLFIGPQFLNGVDAASRAEVLTIFPELAEESFTYPPARFLAKGPKARNLARRHAENRKPLNAEQML